MNTPPEPIDPKAILEKLKTDLAMHTVPEGTDLLTRSYVNNAIDFAIGQLQPTDQPVLNEAYYEAAHTALYQQLRAVIGDNHDYECSARYGMGNCDCELAEQLARLDKFMGKDGGDAKDS
jgi:hypothetical protein